MRLAVFIFFEQFILLSVQKRTKKDSLTKKKAWLPEACESNSRACERVKKVLRRVTHAQGVCFGRSASDCFRRKQFQKSSSNRLQTDYFVINNFQISFEFKNSADSKSYHLPSVKYHTT